MNRLQAAKKNQLKYQISMNKIINNFLLTGDKLHLRQPGFTYSACESITKNKERIHKS